MYGFSVCDCGSLGFAGEPQVYTDLYGVETENLRIN